MIKCQDGQPQICVSGYKPLYAQTYWPTYSRHIAVRPRNAWFRPRSEYWGKVWYPIDARTSDGYCKSNDGTNPGLSASVGCHDIAGYT